MGQQANLALEYLNFSYQNPTKRKIRKFIYGSINYGIGQFIKLFVRQKHIENSGRNCPIITTQQKRSVQSAQTAYECLGFMRP